MVEAEVARDDQQLLHLPARGEIRWHLADFAHQAEQVVGRIERLNSQYADAVAKAVKIYGETDHHSAAALAAITKAMSAPPKGKSGSVNDF